MAARGGRVAASRSRAAGGGPDRVLRGGSWNNDSTNARAAYRNHNHPDNHNDNIGFRVALAAPGSAH